MDDVHTFQLRSADGTALFARHWEATGARATLVLVHGFGEHSGRYGPFGQHMADNGVDVFAVDLRGHGQSAGKRGVVRDYEDYRSDLRALIDHVRSRGPARPVVLFGHSMGGGVVLDHALSPDPLFAGIVASAPLIAPVPPVPAWQRSVVTLLSRVLPNASMKNAIGGAQISSVPAEQARYEAEPLGHDRLGLRTAVELVERGEDIAARGSEIALPLLMLHARGDQLTDFAASEAFAATVPGAQFRAFERVEHELHNDTSRAAVYRAVLDFIKALA